MALIRHYENTRRFTYYRIFEHDRRFCLVEGNNLELGSDVPKLLVEFFYGF